MEERRRRKSIVKWVVVGVAIGVIVAYTTLGVWELNSPKIHLWSFESVATYWSDSDRRANYSVRLHNEGYVDGYAEVIFYIECDGHIQDGEIQTVFVPAHSYVEASADLDVPEPPATYGPRAIILYQWKG